MLTVRHLFLVPVFACLLIGMISGIGVFQTHSVTNDLFSGKSNPVSKAEQLLAQERVKRPGVWIETANMLSSSGTRHDALAIELLTRALAVDPYHPDSWALLSFLHTRSAGAFSPDAAAALKTSFEICGYCGDDLIQWRFSFVLQHWENVSEELRMAAFSSADFLRWWHLRYDYLNDVREQAIARGIPFDEYRRKVGTHVRPNEV